MNKESKSKGQPDVVERVKEEIIREGGLGLVPSGNVIGYDNVTDRFIYLVDLVVELEHGRNYL